MTELTDLTALAESRPDDADDDAAAARPVPPARVTAVLVVHDGLRWLPIAVDRLQAQDRGVDRLVAVDTGSTDGSREWLLQRLGEDSVVCLPRETGFGAAVKAGLDHVDTQAGDDGASADGQSSWIWLLHDDCAPRPDALRQLLVEAAGSRSIGVAGPKVVAWHDRHWLLEVGVTVTGGGRRETGLERHELDQGQHDAVRDVLAVGSAGALIRRDLWDALDGMDPALPMFRDDLDFGWRTSAAGSRVVVVPEAVVYHAEAAAHGRRDTSAAGRPPQEADRRAALHLAAAHCPGWALPLVLLRLTVGSLLRAVGFLLAKDPIAAGHEMRALSGFLTAPRRIAAARRRSAATRTVGERDLRSLKASPALAARHAADAATAALAGGLASASPDRGLGGTGLAAAVARRPLVVTFGAALLLSLLAGGSLWLPGWLAGGALLPAPGGASDLWQAYLSGWHPVGDGSPAPAPPWLALLALAALPTFGSAAAALDVLMLLAIPSAAALAHATLAALGVSRPARWWGSAAYVLLPAATGALAAGRVGTLVVLLTAPVVLRLLLPVLRGSGTFRRAAGAGALLAVPTAFAPVVWPITVVLLAVAALLGPHDRGRSARLGIVAAVPVVLLLPWSASLVAHPSRLLLEAGATGALLQPETPAWRVLFGDPGGPGSTPWPVGALLLVVGLAALARTRRAGEVAAAWLVVAVAAAAALLTSATTLQPPTAEAAVRGWPGPALVLAGGALIVAVGFGAAGLRGSVQRQGFGWQQPLIVGLAGLALAAPVIGAAAWVLNGAGDPLQRGERDPRPAFVAAEETGGRTLLVSVADSGEVGWSLLRRPLQSGDVETATPVSSGTVAALTGRVADLVAGQRRGGESAALAQHAIRYLQLTDPRVEVVQRIDETPGLLRVSGAGGVAVWRVEPTGVPVRILAADGTVTPLPVAAADGASVAIAPGAEDRRLVLAEIADPGWRAALDGVALTAVPGDFQAFALPATGGTVTIEHASSRPWWLLMQGLVVIATLVVLLPGRRPDPDAAAEADDADPELTGQQAAG
jgi:GT2 family glycosyltransferase